MNKNLLILGAGGHGCVVKEVAEAMGIFDKIDFLDDNPRSEVSIGLCSDNGKFAGDYSYAFPAFGNNELRMNWIERLEENRFEIPILIHTTAFISPSASVQKGSIIEAKAVINTNSLVKRGCIVSVGAIIDHDTFIDEGCHIDCGSVVKSNCRIKAFSKVGSGEVITREDVF